MSMYPLLKVMFFFCRAGSEKITSLLLLLLLLLEVGLLYMSATDAEF